HPPPTAFAATAASGIRTIRLRYEVATPRPTLPRRVRRRATAAARAGAACVLAGGSGYPRVLLDLRNGALVRVEELVLHLRPAAEVVDREELPGDREPRSELLEHRRDDRAVALAREDPLGR